MWLDCVSRETSNSEPQYLTMEIILENIQMVCMSENLYTKVVKAGIDSRISDLSSSISSRYQLLGNQLGIVIGKDIRMFRQEIMGLTL